MKGQATTCTYMMISNPIVVTRKSSSKTGSSFNKLERMFEVNGLDVRVCAVAPQEH